MPRASSPLRIHKKKSRHRFKLRRAHQSPGITAIRRHKDIRVGCLKCICHMTYKMQSQKKQSPEIES